MAKQRSATGIVVDFGVGQTKLSKVDARKVVGLARRTWPKEHNKSKGDLPAFEEIVTRRHAHDATANTLIQALAAALDVILKRGKDGKAAEA